MSTAMDAVRLDCVWDAWARGEALPEIDPDEWQVFALLTEADAPAPPDGFLRSLEERLRLAAPAVVATEQPSNGHVVAPQTTFKQGRIDRPRSSRRIPAWYAVAAMVLVVVLSGFAIARQRNGTEDAAIPAVSDWTGAGPPTSAGVTATPLFSRTYLADELTDFDFAEWSWAQFFNGSAAGGAHTRSVDNIPGLQSQSNPGLNVLTVVEGQFVLQIADGAHVWHIQNNQTQSVIGPTSVTLESGASLVFSAGAIEEVWNPLDSTTTFLAGSLYVKSASPIAFSFDDQVSSVQQTGSSIGSGVLADEAEIEVSTETVSIPPGGRFAYSITPHSVLLSYVDRNGLVKQEWSGGVEIGEPESLPASSYSLHEDGPGYYTLTNTGAEPVEVSLFSVGPPSGTESGRGASADATVGTNASPVAVTARTLASQTLSVEQLAGYQNDKWDWIGITQGTIAPGARQELVAGSPAAYDPGYNGLGAIAIVSGRVGASADAGSWIVHGSTGEIETIDSRTSVFLTGGDTLFVPPSSLPVLWNPSPEEATFLAGGVYTGGSSYPLNDAGTESVHGGIRIHANYLAIDAPVTLSLATVEIPAGSSYGYTVTSQTWLEAITSGELIREKQSAGGTEGSPKTMDAGVYSLHMDGFGEYALTNEGTEPVQVSFFRMEATNTADAQGARIAQRETLVNVGLTPEQLQTFGAGRWTWLDFERNTIAPQGDSQDFGSLGKIPGQNEPKGFSLLSVESGTLSVLPESEVLLAQGTDGGLASSPAGTELTLNAGDTIVYPTGTGGTFWNPTDANTVVIGGGGYLRPSAPTFSLSNTNEKAGGPGAGQFGTGLKLAKGDVDDTAPLGMTIERITIAPDMETELTIDPAYWVMAVVAQGDLESTTTAPGGTPSAAVPLRQGEVTLPSGDTKQTVTFRNTGPNVAVVYVMHVRGG